MQHSCQTERKILIKPAKKAFLYKDFYEKEAWNANQLVCGIDEVGRGCLAGPLVTAAVILHSQKTSRLIKDSKLLTHEERVKAYAWIIKNSWYSTGIVSHTLIDTHNIYQATLIAMKRAVMQLMAICPHKPTTILVDAMPLKLYWTSYEHITIHHFPQGERKSSSIAAASIIAKVQRDALMGIFDPLFPGYNLAEHKGYATNTHCKVVRHEGRSIIHRLSFLNNLLASNDQDHDAGNQTTFFSA
jgi:ribonuclease HII